jgi:hypothetical protein
MAQDYGVPPWEIEESCTLEWFKNWSAYRMAEAQESRRQREKAEQRGRRTSKSRIQG